MFGAIVMPKLKFILLNWGLNSVYGCRGGTRVFIKSLGTIGASTLLSSLSLLNSFMFMSCASYTSSSLGTPLPSISLSTILLVGVLGAGYAGDGMRDLRVFI
jgi:hypothetical protein